MYDVIIIGAGPAGISAGIYAAGRGCRTLILEKGEAGGTIGKVSSVTHYAGILEEETGASFAERLKNQALKAGAEIRYEQVTRVSLKGETKTVAAGDKIYTASKLILANGSTPRKLGIPGEAELAGRGIGQNAVRDGAAYRGKNIYVVGGADGAVKEALYLSRFAAKLTILHFEERLGCIEEFLKKVRQTPNIEVCTGVRLGAVYGRERVERLELVSEKDGHTETVEDPGCGIFIYAGSAPNTGLYPELALEDGYIPVNERMETEIPGVYAAGDIRVKQVRQAATAVADGTVAGINAAAR